MATWNVRSTRTGKLRVITSEVQRFGISYGISVLGIAEPRWIGQRHFAGGTIIYSGGKKGGLYGVAIYLDSETD